MENYACRYAIHHATKRFETPQITRLRRCFTFASRYMGWRNTAQQRPDPHDAFLTPGGRNHDAFLTVKNHNVVLTTIRGSGRLQSAGYRPVCFRFERIRILLEDN